MLQNKIINWLQVVSMYYCIYVYIGGDVCVTHIGIILYANPNTLRAIWDPKCAQAYCN